MDKEKWDVKMDITRKGEHYEGYVNGVFVCSGDTVTEVAAELEAYLDKLRGGAA